MKNFFWTISDIVSVKLSDSSVFAEGAPLKAAPKVDFTFIAIMVVMVIILLAIILLLSKSMYNRHKYNTITSQKTRYYPPEIIKIRDEDVK